MRHDDRALRQWLHEAPNLEGRFLAAKDLRVPLADLRHGSVLGSSRGRLADRSVLVRTHDQWPTALALIDLDGLARRIVIAPPDLKSSDIATVMAEAEIDAVVTDTEPESFGQDPDLLVVAPVPLAPVAPSGDLRRTEWVMLTSGTTGAPKMVVHSRIGLTGAIQPAASHDRPKVWGTFYDIRRYGGLQILLRAVLGGNSLVLSQAGEPIGDHLARLADAGVTHLSGTPSHWRRAMMSTHADLIAPAYVRLSGEIADQAILDTLARIYPGAAVGHAYASTEAGVGFEVDDGREGFPARFLGPDRAVAMKIEDGSLRIRSSRTASRYLGSAAAALIDAEGFVDTDDLVEQRGDRIHFVGRRSGIINVGGLKVHPEEVEAVINRHAGVRMSLVKGRSNPITGSIVVADVVLNEVDADGVPSTDDMARQAALKREILQLCREALPEHKVPVLLRFASALAVTPAGKLARSHA